MQKNVRNRRNFFGRVKKVETPANVFPESTVCSEIIVQEEITTI
jgi:hypothetical protein